MSGMLLNLTQDRVLARKIRYCDNVWNRMVGLLATPHPDANLACWLVPCNAIHTFGMKYAIDALFLNKKNKIVAIKRNLKPNRFSPIVRGAHSVVELVSGVEVNSFVGDQLILKSL